MLRSALYPAGRGACLPAPRSTARSPVHPAAHQTRQPTAPPFARPAARRAPRRAARLAGACCALLLLALPAVADAQYFGRNRVRYEDFRFRILRTPQYDVYYYGGDTRAVEDAARMAERWNTRLQQVFDHPLGADERKPIILYANKADFQQTTVLPGFIGEGTGGVTESLRSRLIMPLTGSYADTDHVLGHEMVHVFQYDLAASDFDTLNVALERMPLWFVEGLAEYLSIGRSDPLTSMWVRDAVLRDEFPTVEKLSDPRYFPYRFGHAFWAFVGSAWGDGIIAPLFRSVGALGLERGVPHALGIPVDSLSSRWKESAQARELAVAETRQAPEAFAEVLLSKQTGSGGMNVSPVLSPDGRHVVFLSEKDIFTIELFLADAQTGKILGKLTSADADPHLDALRFLDSAGTWSPDGSRLAYVVTRKGDNVLSILDVNERKVRERIRLDARESISGPAWSPDGRTIAVSANRGGLSDLYLIDVESGQARRITDDRYADLQPAWSPDGRTLAFVTDRGEGTNFETLSYGPMRIGLYDLASGEIRVLRPFPGAKHVDPQYSPDGGSLFFISDRTGVSDVYRLDLATGETFQVTRVQTGVTGITDLSPALSVSRETGRLVFSVFVDGDYAAYGLDAERTRGEPVGPALTAGTAGALTPAEAATEGVVEGYLRDPLRGLLAGGFQSRPYRPRLGLTAVGAAAAGVSIDRYGAGLGGAVGLYFSDMLARDEMEVLLQASGGIEDIGGQVTYQNNRSRWTWGAAAGHIPYRSIIATARRDTIVVEGERLPGITYEERIERQFVERGMLLAQYPFSPVQRIEMGAGGTYISYRAESRIARTVDGFVISRETREGNRRASLSLVQGFAAFVGDNSFFGFTSPVRGQRYRLEVEPTFGSLQFQTLLADYRRYIFLRPVTFAMRGMHYGRFGADAESDELTPLYLGYPSLVRGYESGSFDLSECTGDDCPEYDRLIGSRLAVANLELRVPLFGTDQFGLFSVPALPLELTAFADAGTAWSQGDAPNLVFERRSSERIPVFSAGGSLRLNLLGAAVVEAYYAYPFQRPEKGGHFGFQLAPGW